MTIATPDDARIASPASAMKTKGSTTGKVDRNTSRKTATAPFRSAAVTRTFGPAEGGWSTIHCRMRSSSAGPSAPAAGPTASPMMRRACAGWAAPRTARTSEALRPRSTRLRSTYITPSTKPQARLQPIAATSMSRTSSRPLSITLSVPVKLRTMKSPNRISEIRSIGSRTRALPVAARSSVIGLRRRGRGHSRRNALPTQR